MRVPGALPEADELRPGGTSGDSRLGIPNCRSTPMGKCGEFFKVKGPKLGRVGYGTSKHPEGLAAAGGFAKNGTTQGGGRAFLTLRRHSRS